ncbi:microcystin-dependent protein [Bradyrhizobium sp. JR1.7]|uniref:phage tail protein n=1 Tax=unclassified Bradyrhizobium TaxID=2631580 RepID=UPI003399A4CD
MAADTYSARLGLLEMGTGNQNNSWGTSFNASVTDVVDRAIAGIISHADTGGTLDLSGSPPPSSMRQDIDAIQNFTGTLTSNLTVIVPNLSKTWLFANNTSGAFSLFVKTTAGTATQIPQGATKHVYCDGNNVVKRTDDEEIGSFRISGKAAAGAGELACNGASKLRTDFPDLFSKIGTTWGAVDGTHFTLPLLTDTGRFLRSSTGSLAVGTYQSNLVGAHNHTVTGAPSVGSLGTDNPGNHTHANTLTDNGHVHPNGGSSNTVTAGTLGGNPTIGYVNQGVNGTSASTGVTITNAAAGAHTHTITGAPGLGTLGTANNVGAETRPESAVVLICIKY